MNGSEEEERPGTSEGLSAEQPDECLAGEERDADADEAGRLGDPVRSVAWRRIVASPGQRV